MARDIINDTWNKFSNIRSKELSGRFPGFHRAVVVETNDPLNIGRIRYKCPDLHNFDLEPEECPWATPCTNMGGAHAGSFGNPCIGDNVWITFEKQHPYNAIWVGFADPTRRKFYAYSQISQPTAVGLDDVGKPTQPIVDYNNLYLPKDGRPMTYGVVDRYGNADIQSSVGFFPIQHDRAPPPADFDAVQGSTFQQQASKPLVNDPDRKYMARVTKYGHIFLMGDQGYYWKGEFTGDALVDEQYEAERWLYIQELLNEGLPSSINGDDQRRISMLTRYGHRFELRDVGWNTPRAGEFGNHANSPPLARNGSDDQRWIKLRTKCGMLLQASDIGANVDTDEFIQRPLLQEQGYKSEEEDKYWTGRDGRWLRIVTRHGFKIVLDDRGSHGVDASGSESPHGNGILIKGRRTPSSHAQDKNGSPRGFYWEFNENDQANHTSWGTPLGATIEMNDRYQYMMLATSMGTTWSADYKGLQENEFLGKPTMLQDPEHSAYHLKLDHENEYIRLKSRGGRGPNPNTPRNSSAVGQSEIQQGIEIRDGEAGDGPWVELVDCQHRGMWFSKYEQLGVWRAGSPRRMYMIMDDDNRKIVVHNSENNSEVEVYANGHVKIISSRDITLDARRHIFMKCDGQIRMQAGNTRFTVGDDIMTNTTIHAKEVKAWICGVMPGPGGGCPDPSGADVQHIVHYVLPPQLEPTDRGAVYNGPFVACPTQEIEHPKP